MKKNIKALITLLIFSFLSFNLFYSRVFAVSDKPIDPCKPEQLVYQKSVNIFSLDIRRTVDNFMTSIVLSLFSNVAGLNPDNVALCESWLYERIQTNLAPLARDEEWDTFNEDFSACSTPAEHFAVCENLASDTTNLSFITPGNNNNSNSNVKVMAVNGSLLGLTNMVEGFARNEPLPVNFAYYWNQSISKVPFVNKAFAANEAYENLPVIKAAYGIWTMTLKIALALMSVVLLYTGLMIIMRKKINPQVVVSVQYALPKIVIGTILIVFSYPIGALITSISWGLFQGAFSLVLKFLIGPDAGNIPSGIVILTLILMVMRLAVGGPFYIFIVVIVAVILLILRLVLYLKALMIYLKMTLSIITAPIEFVLGTIPGNDDKMKDWFLRMAKYGITIFAMGLIIPLTLIFSLSVLLSYATGAGGEVGGWGIVIAIIAPILISIFGFGIGINMESKVDEMFSGTKKRK